MGERFDTTAFAQRVFSQLEPRADGALLITLSGNLGAGKTTFTQELARLLGVQEPVTSPTFVLQKIYPLEGRGFSRLVHIDAYRLKGAHELELLDWQKLLADKAALIILEWPERVTRAIPGSALAVRFDIEGERRIITINGKKADY